jgi:hypothetical protein
MILGGIILATVTFLRNGARTPDWRRKQDPTSQSVVTRLFFLQICPCTSSCTAALHQVRPVRSSYGVEQKMRERGQKRQAKVAHVLE